MIHNKNRKNSTNYYRTITIEIIIPKNIQITDIFRFYFPFSALNIISLAIAMQRIFALTKKKIFAD